jgi:hypothetical protein
MRDLMNMNRKNRLRLLFVLFLLLNTFLLFSFRADALPSCKEECENRGYEHASCSLSPLDINPCDDLPVCSQESCIYNCYNLGLGYSPCGDDGRVCYCYDEIHCDHCDCPAYCIQPCPYKCDQEGYDVAGITYSSDPCNYFPFCSGNECNYDCVNFGIGFNKEGKNCYCWNEESCDCENGCCVSGCSNVDGCGSYIPDDSLCSGDEICNSDCECVCPNTCDSLGYECGIQNDGCGGTINCGPCPSGETCDDNGICVIIPTPASCGDGNIDYEEGEKCEPPDTEDNVNCPQETSFCRYDIQQYCVREIHPMGELDPYGKCDSSCQCVDDAYTCRIDPYCDKCDHCTDGVQNCDETGIDVGGPCGSTPPPPPPPPPDSTPPFTSIYCNGETCLDGCWYNKDISISFSCYDARSGCANTRYCFDKTGSCSLNRIYSSAFNLPEGINYVRYFSTDTVGNTETTKSQTVKIDKSLTGSQVLESDIIINYIGSNEEPIDLSYTISPSEPGITVSFETDPIEPPAVTSKMTIEVELGTPAGVYDIKVVGASAEIQRSIEYQLVIS